MARLLIVALSFAASVSALATPNALAVSHNHHRAIAARLASPDPVPLPDVFLSPRQNTRRCKKRIASSSAALASSSPIFVHPQSTHVPTSTTTPTDSNPPPATTKHSASIKDNSNLPSFMVGTQTGEGTFYATGLNACGKVDRDTDFIAAVSHLLFDNFPGYDGKNPNNNPLCGRKVTVSYQGKSVTVTLHDRCAACNITDLDFSPSAFNELADPAAGRIFGITWIWV